MGIGFNVTFGFLFALISVVDGSVIGLIVGLVLGLGDADLASSTIAGIVITAIILYGFLIWANISSWRT